MSCSTKKARSGHGFTLIELLVAMVVSAIVVMGVFAFSSIQQSTAEMHRRDVRVQQALEGAMWTIGRDVRSAGLGFARVCTELRVWDADTDRLINPGGRTSPNEAVKDAETGEAYWVLRDGLQVHWDSSEASSWAGDFDRSSDPDSFADGFDVIAAEGNYVQSFGVFTLPAPVVAASGEVVVQTGPSLEAGDLPAVQQLFPPGSFFVMVPPANAAAAGGGLPFQPQAQGQCPLLQVTGDVKVGPAANQWVIPVGALSGFNEDLATLLDAPEESNGYTGNDPIEGNDDWTANVNATGATIVPLGRLRWSRYEIDYTVPQLPYLVRRDIIGFQDGVDPANLGDSGVDYPHCTAGNCPAAQLHLPGSNDPPAALAIGPMIEDMQVAVGCDGYAQDPDDNLPDPDVAASNHQEIGPATGPLANLPNRVVDENPFGSQRDRDEWLGNAQNEIWAPDCVWYGSAQYHRAGWAVVEGSESPPPNFRMSPQTIRITIIGAAEEESAAGGVAGTETPAAEDRPAMASIVPGRRERFSLTERFTPANLRWRDPMID